MGCYDSCCGVTNTHIKVGDPIVDLYFVDQTNALVLPPIKGTYDDYGRIENLENDPVTTLSMEWCKKRYEADFAVLVNDYKSMSCFDIVQAAYHEGCLYPPFDDWNYIQMIQGLPLKPSRSYNDIEDFLIPSSGKLGRKLYSPDPSVKGELPSTVKRMRMHRYVYDTLIEQSKVAFVNKDFFFTRYMKDTEVADLLHEYIDLLKTYHSQDENTPENEALLAEIELMRFRLDHDRIMEIFGGTLSSLAGYGVSLYGIKPDDYVSHPDLMQIGVMEIFHLGVGMNINNISLEKSPECCHEQHETPETIGVKIELLEKTIKELNRRLEDFEK